MKTKLQYFLIPLLLAPGIAYAHDQSLHKGKPTTGEVVSVADGTFQLKSESGPVKVSYSEKTKFERGDAAATKDDVRVGTHASVFGTKLPGGELVASEVLVGEVGGHGDHGGHGHDAPHGQ